VLGTIAEYTTFVSFLRDSKGRDPKTIVTAHGERVKGKGVVELYVGGALVGTFYVGRKEDLYLGTCEDREPEDKLLFDSRRRNTRKTRSLR
jgi:hypothetical protein